MIEHVIAGLGRHGYLVEAVAIDASLATRPAKSRVNLRFGKWLGGDGGGAVVEVSIAIEMRGNLQTGQLRRWRIARSWGASHDCPGIVMEAALVLDGDINGNFLRQDGLTICNALCAVLADVRVTIAELKYATCGQTMYAPIAVVDVGAVGDLATGRSGLVRQSSGVQTVAREKQDAMLGVADRLVHDVVWEVRALCAEALTQSKITPGPDGRDMANMADANASRSSIRSPTTSETSSPTAPVS